MALYSNDENYLWKLFKPLVDNNQVVLYVDKMDSDIKNAPHDYALLVSSTYDTNAQYGDGEVLTRKNEFNIYIYAAKAKEAKSISKLFEDIMDTNKIRYSKYGPTPDPNTNRFSIMIIGSYHYGKS